MKQLTETNIKLRDAINSLTLDQSKQQEAIRISLEKQHNQALIYERQTIAELKNQVSILTSVVQKPSSMTELGQIGEAIIERWVKELFEMAEVTLTASEPHATDLHLRLQNRLFLLEVKNKIEIHKKDIDKFIRDVEENSQSVHGAIFISLNTPAIPGKGDYLLEYVGETPTIYLHAVNRQTR